MDGIEDVKIGTHWSLRGASGELTMEVTDVVDGVNPVVIYSLTDPINDGSTEMLSISSFVRSYEAIFPDWGEI